MRTTLDACATNFGMHHAARTGSGWVNNQRTVGCSDPTTLRKNYSGRFSVLEAKLPVRIKITSHKGCFGVAPKKSKNVIFFLS